MTVIGRIVGWSFVCLSMICVVPVSAHAQGQPAPAVQPAQPSGAQAANVMTCTSQIGERIQCTADTSGGVALVRSRGAAPCYSAIRGASMPTGIWVADGCSGVFLLGASGASADAGHRSQTRRTYLCAERRIPAVQRRERANLLPALQLRTLPQSAQPGPRPTSTRSVIPKQCSSVRIFSSRNSSRRFQDGFSIRVSATTCTLFGRRIRRKAIRPRSSAPAISVGVQPFIDVRRRHHFAAVHAQHRRPDSLLAGLDNTLDRR